MFVGARQLVDEGVAVHSAEQMYLPAGRHFLLIESGGSWFVAITGLAGLLVDASRSCPDVPSEGLWP